MCMCIGTLQTEVRRGEKLSKHTRITRKTFECNFEGRRRGNTDKNV